MERFDRFWFAFLIVVGAYVVSKKMLDVYFWIWDSVKRYDYTYLTEDHKVIQPTDFEGTIA